MSGAPALAIEDVTVRLQGRLIVDRISLSLGCGEFAIVIGPNGAGKTTLLRAMAGLLPAEGRVSIQGQDRARLSPSARARQMAYLAQSGDVYWPVSVRDVVALGRLPFGAAAQRLSAADQAAIETALEACDLQGLADRRVTELSGGEKARVLLARALAVDAPVLVLDEPVAAFDPSHQIAAMRLLAGLAGRGRTIVAILHDLALAVRFASTLVLLDRGRLADAGPTADVLAHGMLGSVFGLTFTIADVAGDEIVLPRSGSGLVKPLAEKARGN
ncbi:MAG TPA: ABC transporter ATP-binding protein [Beijerinckiaceae bacterium]|nr:ABC transporter ATP-binding protein [Beijerinckiaceae bacterium]